MLDNGILVVLVFCCFNGIVEDIYDYVGGGVGLKKMGVVFVCGLNGLKVWICLIVGLNSEKNFVELKEFLE